MGSLVEIKAIEHVIGIGVAFGEGFQIEDGFSKPQDTYVRIKCMSDMAPTRIGTDRNKAPDMSP